MKALGILGGALALILVSTAPSAALAQKESRIATVDMQQALQSVADGKKARDSLENEFNKKKKELQNEEKELKKMHEELKKQVSILSEKALAKKQAEMQERLMKFQEKTQRSQLEIQQKEQELTAPIIGRLRGVIKKLAKDKGYTVVLEKNENSVLFSLEENDLTTAVIKAYNDENS